VSAPRVLMEYLRLAADYLGRCGSPSARLDAELLLGHVLGMDRVALYVNHDRPLEPAEVDAYRRVLRERCRGTPIAYITGKKEFMRVTLKVTPEVLIPRPETELLVEAVVHHLQARPHREGANAVSGAAGSEAGADVSLLLADVGTGSGAIAIGLALALPGARVLATDVSPGALAVARDNVTAQRLDGRVMLMQGDLLAPVAEALKAGKIEFLDAIVSNPPYISARTWDSLPRSVRDYEPRLALDGGPDGLDVYRRLIPQAAPLLRPGGLLALEIGHDQEPALRELLARDGRWGDVQVQKDYAGHPRVVLATRRAGEGQPRHGNASGHR